MLHNKRRPIKFDKENTSTAAPHVEYNSLPCHIEDIIDSLYDPINTEYDTLSRQSLNDNPKLKLISNLVQSTEFVCIVK